MNRLSQSTSAYLQSAAHQPVHWYEWGEEAFQAAQKEDKPILLDIGAVWCHWCHVIDRESYENSEIADLINRSFIPVKVDVDARPDIDRRYQEAVQALTGQGGWPLTLFLTPEAQVIYGGTYFPPEDRFGMPGMKTLLPKVAETYRTQKSEVLAQSKRLHEELGKISEQNLRSAPLSAQILDRILTDIQNHFDEEYGGFGESPKFPPPTALELLLRRYVATGDKKTLAIVTKTLDGMSRGGMRDQLGGAFHRYSTDRFWRVPHFEVMLYVNAELLQVYAATYQLTREPHDAQVIEELLGYLKETLSDKTRGGFYGSQDADYSPEDDGDYWTWESDEARNVLSTQELAVASRYYGIEAQGEMRENPAKNVLYETTPVPSLAKLLGKEESEVRLLLASARGKLLASRKKRKTPFVDKTIYTNWNGLAISGVLRAYLATGDAWALNFSLKTLDRIWREGHRPEEGLFHVIQEGGSHTKAFLDDYACLVHAFLDAFHVTQDAVFLERAKELTEEMIDGFWDKAQGGFFDTRAVEEGVSVLRQRRKPIQDAPTPAGNSTAAWGLTRLFHLTGETRYRDLAEKTLTSFAATAESHGLFAASFGIALDAQMAQPTQVVILGKIGDARTKALMKAALLSYRPDRTLLVADWETPPSPFPGPVGELVKDMKGRREEPTAFVCIGTQCAPPVTDPEKLKELLHEPRKNPL